MVRQRVDVCWEGNGTDIMRLDNNGKVVIPSTGQGIGSTNMTTGSLCIGNTNQNYGNGSGWNTNTTGLLMECQSIYY